MGKRYHEAAQSISWYVRRVDMREYYFIARSDENHECQQGFLVYANNVLDALTKVRILKGYDFYDRCQFVFEDGRPYTAFGLHKEKLMRKVGRKNYWYHLRKGGF